ncbi:MAG: CDP-alcohol phosphatidyltransferase family protein, partial [Bdellovibrionota bacterium]
MIESLYTQSMLASRMDVDVVYTVVLLLLVLLATISYTVRVFLKGRAHYSRVDKQGGSALLRKELMEAGYWALQPMARMLIFFRVSPNAISFTSLFFAVAAAVCLSVGHFGFGAGFATISAFMDTLDGIVARETGVASEAGEVLDCAIDRYGEFLFLSGLIIYYRSIPTLLVLCLLALAGSYMVSYTSVLAGSLGVKPPNGSMRRPERALFLTLGALLSPITISIF